MFFMRKTSTVKAIRNIVIGLIVLSIVLYFAYVCIFMMHYSFDRAFLRDDAVRFGWTTARIAWFDQVVAAENAFINNHLVAKIFTTVPVIGKGLFIVITVLLGKLGYEIINCNFKHLMRNLNQAA